jgi:FkbM family methyltransferase
MRNIISNSLFRRIYRKLTGYSYAVSYSQTGEDVIIDLLRDAKKINRFTYLDIGANHPVKFNNTYKFYEQGYTGVCIEPDPVLHKQLGSFRKKDVCLNIGISDSDLEAADFFIMSNNTLNTFSKEEAETLQKEKLASIKQVAKIPLYNINRVIETYFNGEAPVFINLDVEGLDEKIIRSLNFSKFRPYIFCIETVHYTVDASSEKREEIFNIMKQNGYEAFADTYINTIFIDKKAK